MFYISKWINMLSTDTKDVNYFLLDDCVNFLDENPENWYFHSMFLDKTHNTAHFPYKSRIHIIHTTSMVHDIYISLIIKL